MRNTNKDKMSKEAILLTNKIIDRQSSVKRIYVKEQSTERNYENYTNT